MIAYNLRTSVGLSSTLSCMHAQSIRGVAYVVVKFNSDLDFVKNNIHRGNNPGGIVFEKIQNRVRFK